MWIKKAQARTHSLLFWYLCLSRAGNTFWELLDVYTGTCLLPLARRKLLRIRPSLATELRRARTHDVHQGEQAQSRRGRVPAVLDTAVPELKPRFGELLSRAEELPQKKTDCNPFCNARCCFRNEHDCHQSCQKRMQSDTNYRINYQHASRSLCEVARKQPWHAPTYSPLRHAQGC